MLTGKGLERRLACSTKGRSDPSGIVYFRTPVCVDHAAPVCFLVRLIGAVRPNMIHTVAHVHA